LVSLELIVLFEDSLWKGLEQITTVLGPEGNGHLSEEGHPVYNLTTFPFVQRISLCCARPGAKIEADKKKAIIKKRLTQADSFAVIVVLYLIK
jgi:hypothetical protein